MGDAENAQQPSKKRGALKELSRENPGLDDEDDDSSALESGTFKTASEEVLASRRIVRVKRRDPSAAAQPASNPFAGIRLVPFTAPMETNKPLPEPSSTPSEEKQETQDDGTSVTTKEIIDGGEKEKSEAVSTGEGGGAENKIDDDAKTKTTKDEDAAGEETEKAEDDKDENEGTDKNGDSGGALSSFQQHSSSKNAFTGLASTGFSTSSFSFGLVSPEGSTGSASLTEQSSLSFGLPNNGNSSPFGTPGSSSATTESGGTATTAFPSKQEVSVETGEENETAAFTADSVMYEYFEGGWKERGKGELKVNVSTTSDNSNARLVMRSKGNYRLILNASIYPEMKLASMDKKGITFACVNSISEAKDGLSTFALKFKDPTVVEEFRAVVEEHKESKPAVVEASAPLKTPEN